MEEKEMQKYLKGTTTVGLVCDGGVVLAADSRATMGYLVSDKEAQKIYKVDDKLGFTTAGMVADNQALVRLMCAQLKLYKLDGEPLKIGGAATLLSNILHQNRMFPLLTQLIVGGYDTEGRIFELDAVGGTAGKKVSSTGSGSPVAYGVIESEYEDGITLENGLKLAVKAVKAALERDAATGNRVVAVKITEKGYEEVPREEIDSILAGTKKEA